MNEYIQTIKAVKIALPAVVGILISKQIAQLEAEMGDDFLKSDSPILKYLSKPGVMDADGLVRVAGCSGFFISSDGYILTNRHVISDESAQYNMVWNNQKYPVTIVARDSINDIAILKCDLKRLPYLKLGDSHKLELGQTVLAIGNALGEFQNTVSRGIVSGLSRHLTTHDDNCKIESQELRGLIQTDAAINPGNSGGPLINLKGEAVGINAVTVLDVENIGFAIPIDQAIKDLEQIKKFGKICSAGLGIRYVLIDSDIRHKHNLMVDYGAYIIYQSSHSQAGIIKNSRADQAGIKEGDIILECSSEKVSPDNSLQAILDKHKIGDDLELRVLRQGKELIFKIPWEC